MAIIQFKDVWEMYRIKFIIDGKVSRENFWALKGICFEVEKGETVGIIGENGAGKSTILKLIAGMLKPDRGGVEVQGKVSGLLELGAGFQPELTGRENIYLNAGLFGLTQSQIDEKYEEIVNFADIGKFINAPVKCYSQGMFVRLAFAIAIHMDPDIFLIDDTLAVGDEHFQRKCIKKIFELKEEGKTIIFVTHDMNMLSRLCKRVLFLKEGGIVEDDLIDKVIPLYTQMIGERRGVGILEKNPLSLIFNNGRFFLNWQDKLLTSNSGAYITFSIANKWYNSSRADWELKKESENKLVATGKFYQLALTQIWSLEIINDYEIKCNIEMHSEEALEIKEGHINIMLINEYTNWFTTLEKGEFPPINDEDKDWRVLLEGNSFRKCIGVEVRKNSSIGIPSLVFEQSSSSHRNQAQISNTDYFTNCRVLQYKTMGLQDYSVTQANRFIYFSGKIILNIPDIDNYLKNLQDEFTLSCGKLKLIFDKGKVILSYNGINLTKDDHIFTSIYINGRWYSSDLAQWEVKKEKENKLIAKGIWSNFSLLQIWEIEITGEFNFSWKINLKINKEVNIEQHLVYFMCCKDYRYWFCDYGSGEFPEVFLETYMDMVQRCIPDGIIGLRSQNSQLPVLSLRFSKELNNFARIFNSDFYKRSRILRIERVESEQNVKFLPGECVCFETEVSLNKDKQNSIEEKANILEGKRLRIIFDNGRGRIYWDGIELTKKLALYTSLHSQGRWYDSVSSAIWKIEERDKDTIKALGKWLHIPINQYWEIRLKENNLIEFDVKMKVDKEIEVDRLQINLMLSEHYSQWSTKKETGHFPSFKEDVDDDWDCIYTTAEEDCIGVLRKITQKNVLPSVKFYPQELNSGWYLNIINSDISYRGRVLQYLNAQKMEFSSGEYHYFKGRILIEM